MVGRQPTALGRVVATVDEWVALSLAVVLGIVVVLPVEALRRLQARLIKDGDGA